MIKDIKQWGKDNYYTLLMLYYNCDSDLYQHYNSNKLSGDEIFDLLKNHKENVPESFVEDVYITLNKRCPKCLLLEEDCIC